MIRPSSAPIYDEVDLKLGIKSSLPSVKPTLALLFLMWKAMGCPSELEYSTAQNNGIILRTDIQEAIYRDIQDVAGTISFEAFVEKTNANLMLKSQLEALLVAFELVWKVAKIRFSDGRGNGSERTGGTRFPKKLWFTVNMDVIDAVCGSDADYKTILLSWLGFDLNTDANKENNLIRTLTIMAESAYFKLFDRGTDVIFNLESLYSTVLENAEPIDVSGDQEAKGPLRILKSAFSEKLIANLNSQNNAVTAIDNEVLGNYAARVSVFHQLNPKSYTTINEPEPTEPQTDNEQAFKDWFAAYRRENGELYSENTRSQYLSGMRVAAAEFADIIAPHSKFFNIATVAELDAIRSALESDERYEEFNRNRGSGELPACLSLYRLFLEETAAQINYLTGYQSVFPRNRILFGAPGTGKSYTLNSEKDELLSNGGEYERVTFHPDYSYANFVGTYKPVPCKDDQGHDAITYAYVPGPFMRTYVKALQNSRTDTPKPFLLIIEEINRANVAAVFGDVFQLLDRGDDEVSEYPIQASEDIKKYLAGELGGNPDDYSEIRIPDNMFIWATMNSADQGVFPMDTAFKRRWDFTYLGIDDSEAGIVGKKVVLGQGEYRRIVEWNALRKAINNELLTYKVNEDKLMGPYFISKKNLPEGDTIDSVAFTRIFKNKVLMYLFDDAAKQKRLTLFGGCDEKAKNQYSKICREFDMKGVFIFCEAISNQFMDVPTEGDGQ